MSLKRRQVYPDSIRIGAASGVRDCCAVGGDAATLSCSAYNGNFAIPGNETWLITAAFSTMALMSFGIGANDAANSWGTSVGSGAVTLTQAVVTGGLMDWLGATLLGSDVHGQDCWACGFCDSKITLFMLGMCAALLATAVFLLLSSTTGMPVSTTHAIIGAVVGMALVGTSPACLDWQRLGSVALTWVTSPIMAGLFGAGLHYGLQRAIMAAPDADQRAMKACPWLAAVAVACISALVLLKSPLTKSLPLPVSAGVAIGIFVCTVIVAHFYIVPMIQWRAASAQVDNRLNELELETIMGSHAQSQFAIADDDDEPDETGELPTADSATPFDNSESQTSPEARHEQEVHESKLNGNGPELKTVEEAIPLDADEEEQLHEVHTEQQQRALIVFKYLLVLVAALESFSHGANHTANSTGAFSAVWATYRNGLESCDFGTTPIWIMAIGGLFVFLGVFIAGARVIQTMGTGLANINFFRGFCIELGSAMAVVLATALGIPVSTTHCQVGAVVFVGWTAYGMQSVKWSMFGWIALTWLITLPSSAGLAALLLVSTKGLIST